MKSQDKISKRKRAQRKVERLKGFYNHITIFIIVNIIIISIRVYGNLDSRESFIAELFTLRTLSTFIVWGAIVSLHGFSVFVLPKILGYDWEERKIEQLMEENLKSKKNY